MMPADGTSLSPFQQAIARSRSYGLFGRLFLSGVTSIDLAMTRAIPELATMLPGEFNPDEAAADHQYLFGFNIFPHESLYMDPAGLLGGAVGEGVLRTYHQAGYPSALSSDSADHIGQELKFLAFLSNLEAQAWQANEPGRAKRLGNLQHTFLDRHLLRWMPPLVLAIRQMENPFYSALADLTLLLASSHPSLTGKSGGDFRLPEAPDILADDSAGLKDIIEHLLTPCYSGFYLGRDDISRLARSQALPRGFGSRRQMLQNLLRSAANYDELETTFGELGSLIRRWKAAYENLRHKPSMDFYVKPWLACLSGTSAMLEVMQSRIRALD